ncbi:hypothetical protein TRAPUB_9445 [Trametes pubescens]|uniref:Uncharacterized protein n=1 Tax=Trametes pubescens TaxID=154538 RepID=A0A1M2W2C0_TRAPU|nr:hypothetical protein TRAPUB_9445 [Trametes pubescens]
MGCPMSPFKSVFAFLQPYTLESTQSFCHFNPPVIHVPIDTETLRDIKPMNVKEVHRQHCSHGDHVLGLYGRLAKTELPDAPIPLRRSRGVAAKRRGRWSLLKKLFARRPFDVPQGDVELPDMGAPHSQIVQGGEGHLGRASSVRAKQ